MIGSRSTGKTNFLASFMGTDSIQGLSLDFIDKESYSSLMANWKQIISGDVPGATAMVDEKPLNFHLRQKTNEKTKDEWIWDVIIKDYAGKLIEYENATDTITGEIQEKLHGYIRSADAILFLVPVEILTWEKPKREFYVSYIKSCVNIAKEEKANIGRSIPFCLGIMKWDQAEIPVAPVVVDDSGNCSAIPEVEQYIKNNPIFLRIFNIISSLSNGDVGIFPISSYGSHSPSDPTKPDPDNIQPLNVLQVIYWICMHVVQSRIQIAKREIEYLMTQEESDSNYTEIHDLCKKLLDSGINNSTLVRQITKIFDENRRKHIEFTEQVYAQKLTEIEADKRCKNPYKEKVRILKEHLNRGLFKPENERELYHNLESFQGKAKMCQCKHGCQRVACLVVVGLIVWCCIGFWNFSNYQQGWDILGKIHSENSKEREFARKNLTAEKFKKASPYFNRYSVFYENEIFYILGQADITKDSFERERIAFDKSAEDTIRSELDKKDRECEAASSYEEKCKIVQSEILFLMDKQSDPKVSQEVFSSFTVKRKELDESDLYYKRCVLLQKKVMAISNEDISKRMELIDDFETEFQRGEFRIPEQVLFNQIAEIKTSTREEIASQRLEELEQYLDGEENPADFVKIQALAKGRLGIYEKYVNYYSEKDPLRTELKTSMEQEQKLIEDLEKYIPLQESESKINHSADEDKIGLIETFLSDYTLENYPKAGSVIDEMNQKKLELLDFANSNLKAEIEPYRDDVMLSFSQRRENAIQREKIYEKTADFYPEDNPKHGDLHDKAEKEKTFAEEIGKYIEIEERFQTLESASENDKLKLLVEFLQTFSEFRIDPYVAKYFAQADQLLEEKKRTILDQFPDCTADTLVIRKENLENRRTKYNEVKETLPDECDFVKWLDEKRKEDDKLWEKLIKWEEFEDAYHRLSLDKAQVKDIPSLENFQGIYLRGDRVYQEYHLFNEYNQKISGKLTEISKQATFEEWSAKVNKFEKDFEKNHENYKKIVQTIKDLEIEKSRLEVEKKDRIKPYADTLEKIQKETLQDWEQSEYAKVTSAKTVLAQDPTLSNCKSAVSALKAYLDNKGAPKEHRDKVMEDLTKYQSILEPRTITVTVKSYDTNNTKFNAWWVWRQNFTFVFNDKEIKYYGLSDAQGLQLSTKISFYVPDENFKVTVKTNGEEVSTTINLIKHCLEPQKNEFTENLEGMKITFTIQGLCTDST